MSKEIQIDINTTANTEGAREVTKSIAQLEKELEDAKNELRNFTGSAAGFEEIKQKAKAAETELNAMQKQLGKLSTHGNNPGMAVLELSRGLEDLQYGVRGVLNNIPPLVLSLGGSAGLAGVISIVAVAASQLFSFLSQGPKDAKKEVKDLLDKYNELKKVFKEFGDMEREDLKDAAKQRSDQLAAALKSIDRKSKVDSDLGSIELARIEAEKRVALSEKSLELSRLEAQELVAGQNEAKKIAERRLEIAQEIEQIEKNALERKRQEEVSIAEKKVDSARKKLDEAKAADEKEAGSLKPLLQKAEALTASLQKMERDKLFDQANLPKQIKAAEKELLNIISENGRQGIGGGEDRGTIPQNEIDALYKIDLLKLSLKKANSIPEGYEETKATLDDLKKTIGEQEQVLSEAADKVNNFAEALSDAEIALRKLKTNQSIDRDADAKIGRDNIEKKAGGKFKDDTKSAIEGIKDLTESIDKSGSKELQAAAKSLKQMISDGKLTSDELKQANTLLAQFGNQIERLGQAQVAALRDANAKIDQVIRDVEGLKLNAKK